MLLERAQPRAAAVVLLALLAIGGGSHPAAAADTRVPIDAERKVLRLDAPLAYQLGLFIQDYPGFQEASLFLVADSTYSLEITRRMNGGEVRERLAMGPAQVDSLRSLVTQRIAQRAPSARYAQEARPLLMASSAVLGFGFYGWALPTVLDVDSGRNFNGTYMVTAAASILVPAIATRERDVSYPMVTLGFYGATRGIAHGVLLADAATDEEGEELVGAALGLSLVESIIGYAWGSGLTPGEAGTIATGGDVGLLYGLGISEISGASDENREGEIAATALIGSAVGIAGGALLGNARDYSYGDAGIMRTAGALGAYTGLSLASMDRDASDDTKVVSAMVGSAVGLAVGDQVVNGAGYSFGQSVGVTFATVAMGLLATGVALWAEPDGGYENPDAVYFGVSALGGIFGYTLSVASQARGGRPSTVRP